MSLIIDKNESSANVNTSILILNSNGFFQSFNFRYNQLHFVTQGIEYVLFGFFCQKKK